MLHSPLSSIHRWVLFRKLNSWIFNSKKWEHYILMHSKNLQPFLQKRKTLWWREVEIFPFSPEICCFLKTLRKSRDRQCVLEIIISSKRRKDSQTPWSPLNGDLRQIAWASCLPSSDVTRFYPRLVFRSHVSRAWRHLPNEPGMISGPSQSDYHCPVCAAAPHFLGQQISDAYSVYLCLIPSLKWGLPLSVTCW